MRILRLVVLLFVSAIVLASVVAGQQQQRPATLDDLTAEVRGLRADIKRASSDSLRTQLLTARLASYEVRISTLGQQLADVRQQLAQNRLTLAPFADQLKQAQETNSQILAPLRNTLEQVASRDRVLRGQETELTRLIESEENRWEVFNSRLDEIERSLPPR
jgi:chromosome segregation ATPase